MIVPDRWSAEVNSADTITRLHREDTSPLEPLSSYGVELLRLSGIGAMVALLWLLCRVWA